MTTQPEPFPGAAPPAPAAGGPAGAAPGGPGGPGGPRGERPRRRTRFIPRRRVCDFCVKKIDKIDYKDTNTLGRYISERGKIEPRRKMGTCSRHQRTLTVALKRARHIALLPFTGVHMRESGFYRPRG
ncbi:MAG TPA: 30S ribosomal protein S18 [Dehalococcoidia bacterium]|nr:30S ribosomal protein S18 [Dehalococcoidia bacterium]